MAPLSQERISGLHFTGAVFTNLSHDHLDYHGSFDAYIQAKKKLFNELPKEAFALVNIDDKNGLIMLQNTRARKLTYGVKKLGHYAYMQYPPLPAACLDRDYHHIQQP